MTHALKEGQGLVFNIQKYSLHDGPGIRTIVFLKGCTLRCRWCSNPESINPGPELAYNRAKCITLEKCGRCVEVCTAGAITRDEEDKVVVNRATCTACMQCVKVCPAEALIVHGRAMTVGEVLQAVEAEAVFYSRSGGGMTISGGEPLLQPGFTLALLREAKRRRINTALETAGHYAYDHLEAACASLDTLLFDVKSLDPAKHQAHVGASNATILSNLRRLRERFPRLALLLRTPLIPGFNDAEADIRAIAELAKSLGASYEILPYHRLAQPKYHYLGREYAMGSVSLDEAKSRELMELAKTITQGE